MISNGIKYCVLISDWDQFTDFDDCYSFVKWGSSIKLLCIASVLRLSKYANTVNESVIEVGIQWLSKILMWAYFLSLHCIKWIVPNLEYFFPSHC